jgi:phenylalanyl-tRNA synthetase beta chain
MTFAFFLTTIPVSCVSSEDQNMFISRNWLNTFVDTSHKSADELVDAFNELGLVVEGVQSLGEGLDSIVTAKVQSIRKHPQADKIRLVDVITAVGQTETLQICCGAWNFFEGDVVPLAPLGTVMPDGMHIEKRKLRGEWSNGMLCSGREMKLSEDHEGIMRLPADTPLGIPIVEALGIVADTIFDLSIEANRPDAMSVRGVARDLAPKIGGVLKELPPTFSLTLVPKSSVPRGSITAPDLCDRLTVTVITGVAVTESPDWVKSRVIAGGMRPINNLVDASNLVMLEIGIPSHAFDLARLAGGRIDVRWASTDEHLITLDGVDRKLSPAGSQDGVIADGNGTAVGIAAIMGGLTSEVDATTTSVLLEVAHWTPMCVARSSKRMGLRSEASARFERGSDPGAIPLAVARFVDVVGETCPSIKVESYDELGPNAGQVSSVRVRTSRANLLLGTNLGQDAIIGLLNPIGFTAIKSSDADVTEVAIPSWRPDSTAEVDVIEEIGRHFGYKNIERRALTNSRVGQLTGSQRARRTIGDVLVANNCQEVWTASFLAPADIERAGHGGEVVSLANPMVAEESVLRPSLIPGMLRVLGHNANHRTPAMRLFELGHVFGVPMPNQVVPYERDHLAVAFAADDDDARTATRALDTLIEALGINSAAIELKQKEIAGLHPTRSARVVGSGTGFNIGSVGEIDPDVCKAWGVDRRVGILVLDVENLSTLPKRDTNVASFSRFPSSDVDLAFVVNESVPAAHVGEALRAAGGALLQSVRLFDVYRGGRVAAGSRGLTYRLRFADFEKTLTDADVATVRAACIDKVAQATGAILRS